MKKKSEPIYRPMVDKSPERLKRPKDLNERVRGQFRDFMTQEDLRKMREDDKWQTTASCSCIAMPDTPEQMRVFSGFETFSKDA